MNKGNKILYHGSSFSGIKNFKPQPHVVANGKEIVFATDHRNYALAMIYGTGEELAVSYVANGNNKKEMYVDELQPGKLELLKRPGCLYEVDAKYFEPSREGLESEYISYAIVPVLSEIKVIDVLGELRGSPEVHLITYEELPKSMAERGKISSKPMIKHSPSRFL